MRSVRNARFPYDSFTIHLSPLYGKDRSNQGLSQVTGLLAGRGPLLPPKGGTWELMFMNLKIFEVRNTTTKTARRTALVLLAAAFVSLPLHGQQASGSDSAASAPDLNAADQAIPPAVKERLPARNKRIEQITEKSPMDPTRFALDDGATAGSSTSWGNPDPQEPEHPTNQQSSGTNSNYTLKGNFLSAPWGSSTGRIGQARTQPDLRRRNEDFRHP